MGLQRPEPQPLEQAAHLFGGGEVRDGPVGVGENGCQEAEGAAPVLVEDDPAG